MSVDWKDEGALYIKDFKSLFTAAITTCISEINESDLGYDLNPVVLDYFKYSPCKNKNGQINYNIATYTTDIISDENAENGTTTEINMTITMRIIPSQNVDKSIRVEDNDNIVNLVVNYINNEIKSLGTTFYWFNFRTGGIENDLYWVEQAVKGSQIIVTCKMNLQGYTT